MTTTLEVEAILFDNDGVLIDSTHVVEESWRTFASWYDLPVDDVLAIVHGRRSRDVIETFASAVPVPPEDAWRRYIDACLTDFVHVDVLPGVTGLLTSLPPANWAVVTSGTRIVTTARMTAANLPTPPAMVTAEDITIGKPDPAPYLKGAELLGIAPADCLVVEDAPAGIESGTRAGCQTLALLTTHERASLAGATAYAADLRAVSVEVCATGLRVHVQESV